MKKINLLVFVLIVLASLSFLIGCKKADKKSSEVVTLKIIIPWVNEELQSFLPVIEAFEKENPNIKVEYQSIKPEDVSTLLSVQFSSKTTPADVIDTSFGWFIREQANRGHILNLDGVFNASDYVSGSFNEVSTNGSVYGVPSVGGITVTEYRKSILQSLGLDNINNFNGSIKDLFDMVRTKTGKKKVIASGGGVGWTFTSIVETIILSTAGKDLHDQLRAGKISWTDPTVVNLFTKEILPLIQGGYFGEPDEYEAQLKAMWNGNYTFFVGDSTDSQIIDPPTDRGVFLLPGQKTVMLWNDYWFVPQYTAHPEEAKILIKFIASKGQEILISKGGRIGTYLGINQSSYPESEKDIFELLNNVAVVPDLDDTIGGKFQSTFWDQLALLWAKPTKDTLNSVLTNLQKASEETLGSK